MDANLVLKNRAAANLLAEMQADPELVSQLAVYFAPYCDCNITDWIVARVIANDTFVKAKIRELIAPMDNFPLLRGNQKPVAGQLLTQYCLGDNFVGIYADGNGGEIQRIIEANSEAQNCKPPETVEFFLPWNSEQSKVDAGSDGVIFMDEPMPSGATSFIGGQKIFFSSPRTPRLQIKIGSLAAGDYQNLRIELFSQRDNNGNYPGNPNAKIPFNTEWNDWEGTLTAVYNPSTRITKLQTNFSQTAGGAVYLTYLRDEKIIGWVNLGQHWFDYDASTGLPTPFMTFIANPMAG